MAEVSAEGPVAESESTALTINSTYGEMVSSPSEAPASKDRKSIFRSWLPWMLVLVGILVSLGVAFIMFDVVPGGQVPIILDIKEAESLTGKGAHGGLFAMDFDPTKVMNDAVEEFGDLKNLFLAILSDLLMDEDDSPSAVRKKGEFLPPRRPIEEDYLPTKKKELEIPKEKVTAAPVKKEPEIPKEKDKAAPVKKEPEIPKEKVKAAPVKKEPEIPKEKVKAAPVKKEAPDVPKEKVKPAPAETELEVPKEKIKPASVKTEHDVSKEKPWFVPPKRGTEIHEN